MNNDMKFEEAMTALENITSKLESGELTLEDAISAYERAIALVKICNEKLENAEKRVKILTEARDGSVTVSDFVKNEG